MESKNGAKLGTEHAFKFYINFWPLNRFYIKADAEEIVVKIKVNFPKFLFSTVKFIVQIKWPQNKKNFKIFEWTVREFAHIFLGFASNDL